MNDAGGFERDGDLALRKDDGIAWQISADRVPYDADYLAKVDAYEGTPIAQTVNAARCSLLLRHVGPGATVLDVGAGSGAFVRVARSWGFDCLGYDVITAAVEKLRDAGMYGALTPQRYQALTFWDSLEHMEDPGQVVSAVLPGCCVLASIPVFKDLSSIRDSKHYRPGEHLHYWTESGFVGWMEKRQFRLLELSDHETKAGRESIGAFAFRKTGDKNGN